ncbi:hypothetical protein HBI56_237590 [Parastagonospora nodorum]|nr:hypothetical protein HBH51_239660 [Parastagonospora nodorum]KAH3995043.1 hypothetical protein HBI10_178120 [Parastagonospora nodorum]KAH4010117.1 hypothetical protein HBI09_232990 [Parastagonospora nodorum]KAH4017667.1 hypothetical protein HBI13_143720 [Parastagonospora nodorum]KAH4077578.1 hypothetical protein HBH46_240870 [Parastagonospora nodorum]
MSDLTAQIQGPVQTLKIDRDTWKAVALKYKAAFEAQTSRFKELQDLCFATQAELQNERVERRQLQELSEQRELNRMSTIDGADEPRAYGTATVFRGGHQRQASRESSNPLYSRVQHCIDQRNYGSALAEIERLLQGPLSAKARAEGLLLKSNVLRAAGPDEVYGALAACSEALELCDRISDLESFLPRIQHQRGVLYYQLRMLQQARDAFSAVSSDDPLFATAREYRSSCDEEIRLQRNANRRSAFDENRTFDEGMVMQLDEKLDAKRRRTSAQLRLRAAVVSKRMSLPRRWVSGKGNDI